MKFIFNFAALTLALLAGSAVAARSQRPLPRGYHHGRCLLVVRKVQRMNGPCFYQNYAGGGFGIHGPKEVFGGRDTVDRGSSALTYSRDWWADVYNENGRWSGYGNEQVGDVHGGRIWWLRRKGNCFYGQKTIVGDDERGEDVKLCLWRS